MIVGEKNKAILALLLLLFNSTDWFFTWYGIKQHYVEEANPLLAGLFSASPFLILIWKVAAPLALLFLLPCCKQKWIIHGAVFAVCLYTTVNLYHLLFFVLYLSA
ncbi:DUF5658 family protein [Aneurinibacillus tyrosinisolvens]|uniref:DUF5658 family protein n=1 Tax=Aneurinibacillus tyrosinisolvens TaxID=1443435 RepID=UPI00063F0913|nr:DUF5658 family protein [Aneurinibacillus tyrosinisolvens]